MLQLKKVLIIDFCIDQEKSFIECIFTVLCVILFDPTLEVIT